MARPGQLVEIISDVFGLQIATVREQARVLRKAGLMTPEKAGRGGGAMTPRDAVNLILATAGTGRTSKSVRVVQLNGQCKTLDGSWANPVLPLLQQLPSEHRLADLLKAILQSLICGDIAVEQAADLHFSVTIQEPGPSTAVAIGKRVVDQDGVTRAIPETKVYSQELFPKDGSLADPAFTPNDDDFADLRHSHRFGIRVFREVAALLRQ